MKNIFTLLMLLIINSFNAQNITFPDVNFKNFLISKGVDGNTDGEISQAEAAPLWDLVIDDQSITDVTGINFFTGLNSLKFTNNSQVTSLDISALTGLQYLTYYSGDTSGSPFKLQSLTFPSSGSNLLELKIGTYEFWGDPNPQATDVTRNYTNELNLDLASLTLLEKLWFTGSVPIHIVPNTFGNQEIGVYNSNPSIKELYLDMAPYNLNGFQKRFTLDVASGNEKIFLKNVNVISAGALKEITFVNVLNKLGGIISVNDLLHISGNGIIDGNSNLAQNLTFFWVDGNPIYGPSAPNPDYFTESVNLESLYIIGELFEKINLSQNTNLKNLAFNTPVNNSFSNTTTLYINLKNGRNLDNFQYSTLQNPNLAICVDDLNYYQTTFPLAYGHYTTNCTTTPFHKNVIKGKTLFDAGNNGCTNNAVNMPSVSISSTNGSYTLGTYSDNDGNYIINFPFYQTPTTINTNATTNYTGLSVAPNVDNWAITSGGNDKTVNFCISGSIPVDADIAIASGVFRPGINSTIPIYINNKSGQSIAVNPKLIYDNTKFNFVSTTDSGTNSTNEVNWSFTLQPFEQKKLLVHFFIPTNVQGGDIASFSSNLGASYTDANNANNAKSITLTAVNSYDPNDKTAMEGATVQYSDKDKFLNYRIRFQNTGTAEAINVVVVDNIQPNYDLSTLEVLGSSHTMRTEILGNQVKFIFDNINLDWEANNEPASHGFVDFRIRPISSVSINETLENKGEIYFDYNLPIITNKSIVTIVSSTLNVENNTLNKFQIYPNPTKDKIYFKDLKNISKVNIYDLQGRLMKTDLSKHNYSDLSALKKGIYFIEILSNGKTYKTKVIKE